MTRAKRIVPALAWLLTATACPATPAPRADRDSEPAPAPAPDRDAPVIVMAPAEGDVAEIVRAEVEQAKAQDQQVLVYVGAHWCEPCQYFHAAIEDGSLDDVFPKLRLVEFDLDRDRERLDAAGYSSRMIPLFVAPGPDGRAGPRRTEGGIKGPDGVAHLQPRVAGVLEAAAADAASRPR